VDADITALLDGQPPVAGDADGGSGDGDGGGGNADGGEGDADGGGGGGGDADGGAAVRSVYTPSGIIDGIHRCAGDEVSETRAYNAGEPLCSVRALPTPLGSMGIPSSGVAISHSRLMYEARSLVYNPPM